MTREVVAANRASGQRLERHEDARTSGNEPATYRLHHERALIADRATALGWRRQVLDLLSWSLLTNTLAWHSHRQPDRAAA